MRDTELIAALERVEAEIASVASCEGTIDPRDQLTSDLVVICAALRRLIGVDAAPLDEGSANR